MILALFLVLFVVQGSKFDFRTANEMLKIEMKSSESRFLIIQKTLQPVRPIGEPYEEPTEQPIHTPAPVNPFQTGPVYDDLPGRMLQDLTKLGNKKYRHLLQTFYLYPPSPAIMKIYGARYEDFTGEDSGPQTIHDTLPTQQPLLTNMSDPRLANQGHRLGSLQNRSAYKYGIPQTLKQSSGVLVSQPSASSVQQFATEDTERSYTTSAASNSLKRPIAQISPQNSIQLDNKTDESEFFEYLTNELSEYNFRSMNRYEEVRKVITFIYTNDYYGYKLNESYFRTVFKHDYALLEKRGNKMLQPYIIRFGATKFMNVFLDCGEYESDWNILLNAYLHMIKTKDLAVIQAIMKKSRFTPDCFGSLIASAIKIKYPHMKPSDRKAFESSIPASIVRSVPISISSDLAARFEIFKTFIRGAINTSNDQLLNEVFQKHLKVATRFPDFFMSLDPESKFLLARVSVCHEDVEALIKIIELDPKAILMMDKGLNLFDIAVMENKKAVIPLLLNVVPELAMLPRPDGRCCLYQSIIMADNVEMIQEFENAGFNSENRSTGGKNAIQFAFLKNSLGLMRHFMRKYGREKVENCLNEIYDSPFEVQKVLNNFSFIDEGEII